MVASNMIKFAVIHNGGIELYRLVRSEYYQCIYTFQRALLCAASTVYNTKHDIDTNIDILSVHQCVYASAILALKR